VFVNKPSLETQKENIENLVSLDEPLKREYLVVVIEAQAVRGWLRGEV